MLRPLIDTFYTLQNSNIYPFDQIYVDSYWI